MKLEDVRRLLGARAVRERWSARSCGWALEARLEAAAGSNDSGTWACAVWGDGEDAELVAQQGVDGAEAARARWVERAGRYRAALEASPWE